MIATAGALMILSGRARPLRIRFFVAAAVRGMRLAVREATGLPPVWRSPSSGADTGSAFASANVQPLPAVHRWDRRRTVMPLNRTARALGALAGALALSFVLAACGDDEGDPGSAQVSATEHNDADVAFSADMIQHHAQALAMVDLTLNRPLDPEVAELAEQIRDAQAPEIELFGDWLVEWDAEVPETVRDHGNAGHDTDALNDSMDSDMPGAMTADDLAALGNASDADFQSMWLEMMVEHHEGAVTMARAETEDGRYQPAVKLAESIVSSQSKQIDTMEDLLG